MNSRLNQLGRSVIILIGIGIAIVVGWWVFVRTPTSITELLGILLVIFLVFIAARIARHAAESVFPSYNVAEVEIEGPITRDGQGVVPTRPSGIPADSIVEQIDRANEDRNTNGLLLKLNTPGGEVVPSDDIRLAAESFEGPTIAYATDRCASGGYWIASGCDELWARDASIVGSIGVIGSIVNTHELADRVGISYERFAAGKYKDAGFPLKEITDDERDYLQGLIDRYYAEFIDRITDNRDLDADTVRDTEARVYLGTDAVDHGLVDNIGAYDDVVDRLETILGEPVFVREFAPEIGFAKRLRQSANALAYSFGAGIASVLERDHEFTLEFR